MRIRVHRNLSATFVTMADPPLSAGQDGDSLAFDLPDGLSGIFFARGLDRKST